MREIELWSDSFHEGDWACEHLYKLHLKKKLKAKRYYENGFVPVYQFFLVKKFYKLRFTVHINLGHLYLKKLPN